MAGEPERAGGSADAALPAAAAPLPCQKLSHRETVWPPESIDPNDAMILPHGANPDRMKFSERTGLDRPTFQRFDEAKPGLPSYPQRA